jgi:peroxiredoxin
VRNKLLPLFVLILITAGCTNAAPTPAPEVEPAPTKPPIGLAPGYVAPELTLTDLQGETVRLSDLRGQPVLINFWAVWCTFCRIELPEMQEVYQEHRDSGFVILAVDVQEEAAEVRAFVEELGLTFPILLDSGGAVTRAYRVRGLPTSYFVGADGIILGKQLGPIDREWMAEHLALAGVESL